MPESTNPTKPRHLVRYDYGMGGLLWWIHAASATDIVESLAGVEVLTDPDAVREAEGQDLKVVDLDGALPVPLSGMRAERIEQQTMPGFGALVGRERVYLAWGRGARTFVELGPDGRVLRQVTVSADGVGRADSAAGVDNAPGAGGDVAGADDVARAASAVRADDEERASQPPFDLYDPQYVDMEIKAGEFEQVWSQSH